MKIHDDHMYHGAALTQIAEHPQFTAINSFKMSNGTVSRNAFKINDDIGVYLKYASQTRPPFSEYVFTFQKSHLAELQDIADRSTKVVIALVCVKAREICALQRSILLDLVKRRVKAYGGEESQYVVLVTATKNQSFRAYVNLPGARKKMLGKPVVISRNDFPCVLFE